MERILNVSFDYLNDMKLTPYTRILHITHNDGDGVGCAIVSSFMLNSILDIYFCNTGNGDDNASDVLMNILTDKDNIGRYNGIIISDVSIRDDVAEFVDNYCKDNDMKILMVDHHPTNKLSEKYNWVKMSEPLNGISLSAAATLAYTLNNYNTLVFNYYNSSKEFIEHASTPQLLVDDAYSYFISKISRYDTWEWKKTKWSENREGDEDEITIMIKTFGPVETFRHITNCIINQTVHSNDLARCKKKYFQDIENRFNDLIDHRAMVITDFHDFKTVAYLITGDTYISIFQEKIFEKYKDEVSIVLAIDPLTRTIHLRSKNPDVHVGNIAKLYDGGGHAAASGATNIDDDVFCDYVLKTFYRGNYITSW